MSTEPATPRRRRPRRSAPGTSPGTLVGDADAAVPIIRLMAYGPATLVERTLSTVEEIPEVMDKEAVTWVNVDGVRHAGVIARIGEIFKLHRLAVEDVVNTSQRPKVEQYPGLLFIVTRLLTQNNHVDSTQFSLFLGPGFVLTFQEQPGHWFEQVRARIRAGTGRLRTAGPGYLAYALLDAAVDHCFPVLEAFGERLEGLETAIVAEAGPQILAEIRSVKRDLLTLRRAIWPLRDVFGGLLREAQPHFQDEDRAYLQDCYDHTVQVIDLVESYREVGSGLMDVYLSTVSNRMNEVMKVLTMFASVFIPLSFIAGIYGMNFDSGQSPWNLPELHWYFGYPFALALMFAVAGALTSYFWRRGWIGRPPSERGRKR